MRFLKLPIILAIVVVIAFASLASVAISQQHKLKQKDIKLNSVVTELHQIKLERASLDLKLSEEVEKNDSSEETIKQLQQQVEQNEQRRQQLEQELSAKREAARLAVSSQSQGGETPVASIVIEGDKHTWFANSGIPSYNWQYVDYIVTQESQWNPCAYNPNQSNCNLTAAQVNETQPSGAVACGLGQSLPCGKWGDDWTNPQNQLARMNNYVNDVYGGWPQAYIYWRDNGHY